jgi:signal transduction histidine kinase
LSELLEAGAIDAATSQRSWRRVARVWQAAFCLTLLIAGLVAGGDHAPWFVYLSLAGMAASFTWLLMPAIVSDGRDWRFPAHLAVVTLTCYAGVLGDGSVSFIGSVALSQFIPMLGLGLRGVAILSAAALLLTFPVAIRAHFSHDAVTTWLITATSAWVINMFIGSFTGELINNSERRGALIRQLEETRAELERAHHEAGVREERERLAREIHDTLAQGFTSILMLVQAADATLGRDPAATRERLALAEQTARENLAEARALIGGDASAGLPLDAALRRAAERVGRELTIEGRVLISGDPRPLSADVQVVTLRVAQEALANVRKHAQAESFEVRLEYREDGMRLTVTDDGVGLPAGVGGEADAETGSETAAPTGTAFGLRSMRDRVEQIGGVFAAGRGTAGTGTQIAAVVPYE